MKEYSTRQKINMELEWLEAHRLKISTDDPDVQENKNRIRPDNKIIRLRGINLLITLLKASKIQKYS